MKKQSNKKITYGKDINMEKTLKKSDTYKKKKY